MPSLRSSKKSFSYNIRWVVVACICAFVVFGYFLHNAFGGTLFSIPLTTNSALSNGLLAYYSFDKGTMRGGVITDQSANNKNLTYASACLDDSQSITFVSSTVGTSTWVVPAGVTSITAKVWGGGGGGGGANNLGGDGGMGGGGGFAQATLAVTPGDALSLIVGDGGYGGTVGTNNAAGGGGGGFSAIHKNYTYYIIAGGGGGGAGDQNTNEHGGAGGAGGGIVGQDGSVGLDAACGPDTVGNKGNGGTQTAGGSGGSGCSTTGGDGSAGGLLYGGSGGNGIDATHPGGVGGTPGGGSGGNASQGGGGGGGGYYGGGGGEGGNTDGGGGGGGGSSYITGTATSTIMGNARTPGNTSDTDYANNAGFGAATTTGGSSNPGSKGNPGRLVISFTLPSSCFQLLDSPVVTTVAGTSTWTVPAGVTSITVKGWGGGGGGGGANTSDGGPGGGGGFAQATLAVTPGDIFSLIVGGGGGGGKGQHGAGGGGGYSAVHKNFTYYIVAAGGGGGGGSSSGVNNKGGGGGAGGGVNGIDGNRGLLDVTCGTGGGAGGYGGTQTAGGAGGSGCSTNYDGSAGSAMQGGAGGINQTTYSGDPGMPGGGMGGADGTGTHGGGGGGGYYGGGGGESAESGKGGGGGGGGSSYANGTATSTVAGYATTPGNTADSNYAGSAGVGAASTTADGSGGANGNSGRVVVVYTAPAVATGTFMQTPGTIGQALKFNGTTDVATTSLAVNGVQTIAFWAKPNSTTQSILELGPTGKNITLASGVVTTGLASPTIYVDGVQTTTFPNTDWHHVVVMTGSAVDATALKVGVASSTYFNGSLDDVRMYNRTLSGVEVKRLYDLGATTRIAMTLNTNPKLANNLIDWWTFDGPDVDLSSSTGELINHVLGPRLNWINHASTTVPGVLGQAISFDGINDAANASIDLSGTNKVTVAMWFKVDTLTQNATIFLHGSGSNYFLMRPYAAAGTCNLGDIMLEGRGSTGPVTECYYAPLSSGTWYHFVAIYDKSQPANGEVKFYLNGVLQTAYIAQETNNNTDSFSNSTLTLMFNSASIYQAGSLDDFRLYNSVLSATDIKRLYDLGVATKVAATLNTNPKLVNGLISWWTFDGPDVNLSQMTAEIRDKTGSANLNWQNHATTTIPGPIGQGIFFDGINDFMSTTSAGVFGSVQTIAFWAKPNSTTQSILELGPTGKNITLASGVVTTGLASPTIYVDGVQTTTFPNTDWHHVVVMTGSAVDATALKVGVASSTYFNGSLDDVRMYNRTLSGVEVKRLYEIGK